jgi:excisionase family DNA binding protein
VSDRLLKAREVAELLGLSPATVLDWFESGRLPGFKLSTRAVRFRESEILAWLDARYVASRDASGVSCGGPDRGVG